MNFDWTAAGPGPGIGPNHFMAHWRGAVQAQYSEPYTFTVIAPGRGAAWRSTAVRSLMTGRRGTAPATNRAGLALSAQQLYNVQLDYLAGNGAGLVQLLWSSPSTASSSSPPRNSIRNQSAARSHPGPAGRGGRVYGQRQRDCRGRCEAPHNVISRVDFQANGNPLGSLTNSEYAPVYALTSTGLAPGRYALTAVATDGSGLAATSAPVTITVTDGGRPYGLTNLGLVPAYLKMPATFNGLLPPVLSRTGVFADTTSRTPADGLIPYQLNLPAWSDGAVESDYLAVPRRDGPITPDEQLRLRSTNAWTFPNGTVLVKNLDLTVDERHPDARAADGNADSGARPQRRGLRRELQMAARTTATPTCSPPVSSRICSSPTPRASTIRPGITPARRTV